MRPIRCSALVLAVALACGCYPTLPPGNGKACATDDDCDGVLVCVEATDTGNWGDFPETCRIPCTDNDDCRYSGSGGCEYCDTIGMTNSGFCGFEGCK